MLSLTQALNQQIAGIEATMYLSNGDSFRIKGNIESVSEIFISVVLSSSPDGKGRKMVNVNHIVSIDWYVK